jgi:hypothetical protein
MLLIYLFCNFELMGITKKSIIKKDICAREVAQEKKFSTFDMITKKTCVIFNGSSARVSCSDFHMIKYVKKIRLWATLWKYNTCNIQI